FGACGNCVVVYAVVAVTRPGAPWTMLTCAQPPAPCNKALAAIHPYPRGVPFSPGTGDCPTSARCYGLSAEAGNSVNWSADGGELWLEGASGASSTRN